VQDHWLVLYFRKLGFTASCAGWFPFSGTLFTVSDATANYSCLCIIFTITADKEFVRPQSTWSWVILLVLMLSIALHKIFIEILHKKKSLSVIVLCLFFTVYFLNWSLGATAIAIFLLNVHFICFLTLGRSVNRKKTCMQRCGMGWCCLGIICRL